MATRTRRGEAASAASVSPAAGGAAGEAPARAPSRTAAALRIASAGGHDAPAHTEPRHRDTPPAAPKPSRARDKRASLAPDTNPRRHEALAAETPPPAAPRRRGPARKQFAELREALAGGWEIVQPVFARPLWSAADDSLTAYSFVLRRDAGTRLVTVPGGRLVERFIATQRLSVDERR